MEGKSLLACDNAYFFKKLYQSYVFSNEIDNVLSQIGSSTVIFQDDSLLNYLDELVDDNYDFHYLDKVAKDNILNIIQFLRNCKNYTSRDDYKDIISKLNNMISKLNGSTEENVADFYYLELEERFDLSNERIRNLKMGRLEIVPEEVRQMMCLDILVLLNLNAEENSYNEVFDDLVNNEFVICSIRKMMNENSKLFKDKRIYQRTKQILENNRKTALKKPIDYQFYKNNYEMAKKLIKIQKDK